MLNRGPNQGIEGFMTKRFILVSAASAFLLVACGSPENTGSDNATASKASFSLPQECENHPLLPALPELAPIGGKALTSVSCQPFSVEMIWGEAGTSTTVILVDSQGPAGDLPAGLVDMARNLPLQAAKTAISLTKGVQETALAYPTSLAELGGEDFLSAVEEAPGGLLYALDVEPKDAGGLAGAVVGTIKDRYALTINIEQDNVVGITAAKASYAPWLSALRLSQLP